MRRSGKKVLFVLALLFFTGVAAFSGYKVYTIVAEYRVGEESAQSLQQYVTLQPEADGRAPAIENELVPANQTPETADQTEGTEVTEPTEPGIPYPVVDFEALQQVNSDVIGWICIEGTKINYPIVQTTDNDYYLNRLVDRTYNGAGSIFMDFRNLPDFSDYHTVIYGHNMKNGTMFAPITDYKKKGFHEEHPVGMIMTPEKNFRFEIIGGYVADPDDPAWNLDFNTEEECLDWLRDAMRRSTVGGDYVPTGGEKIITLSTCSYEFDFAKYVLICRVMDDSERIGLEDEPRVD